MGGGTYSSQVRAVRADSLGYSTKSADQIFEQNQKRFIHEAMDPKEIRIRESRDSAEHPNSVPIIIALDETGSMGRIPHELIKDGLPHIMDSIIKGGIADPQVLFLGIGDHKADSFPLQVAQFESSDEKLDYWLTKVYLEGNGGGNGGESYLLAWYFAAHHTVTDAWEKRQKKGFLFTVGDEPCHDVVSSSFLRHLMKNSVVENDLHAKELLEAASKTYEVYHIHINHGSYPANSWKQLMGERCIEITNHLDVAKTIARIVTENSSVETARTQISTPNESVKPQEEKITL
jgi:hypothetical protein